MHVRDLFPGSGEHSSPSRRLRGIGQWRSGAAIADAVHTHAALLLSDDLSDDEMLYLSHKITTSADRLQAMAWPTAAAVAGEIAQQARALLADPESRWIRAQHIAVLQRVLDQSARAEAKAVRARRAAA
ncbi:MAG: hypothetical protein K8I04_06885 [Gammaproteobacteria bacterium]|nr:hypothetical protein [Gammaproteobacteria bacterium]